MARASIPKKLKQQSLGLVGMQERAFLLNGDLKIAWRAPGWNNMTLTSPRAIRSLEKKFAMRVLIADDHAVSAGGLEKLWQRDFPE